MRVFLDANILFSAALGGEVFRLIWQLAAQSQLKLLTSTLCLHEARVNLERKYPTYTTQLRILMKWVNLLEDTGTLPVHPHVQGLLFSLPEKDRPMLEAALLADAQVLLTGDLRHFGPLMNHTDLPLRVFDPRSFIRYISPRTTN